MKETKISPLAVSPQFFHSKLKTLNFDKINAILNHPLPPTSLPVSTPNSIHLSRLTLSILTLCLLILFWIEACAGAGFRVFTFVGAVEISNLRSRYDYEQYILLKLYFAEF